jgi:hypothetical protein
MCLNLYTIISYDMSPIKPYCGMHTIGCEAAQHAACQACKHAYCHPAHALDVLTFETFEIITLH